MPLFIDTPSRFLHAHYFPMLWILVNRKYYIQECITLMFYPAPHFSSQLWSRYPAWALCATSFYCSRQFVQSEAWKGHTMHLTLAVFLRSLRRPCNILIGSCALFDMLNEVCFFPNRNDIPFPDRNAARSSTSLLGRELQQSRLCRLTGLFSLFIVNIFPRVPSE